MFPISAPRKTVTCGVRALAVRLKTGYFRARFSPLRNCAAAQIIVQSLLIDAVVKTLAENLGSTCLTVNGFSVFLWLLLVFGKPLLEKALYFTSSKE